MCDLNERLQGVDRVAVPDEDWRDVELRALRGTPAPAPRRKLPPILVATTVTVVSLALLIGAFGGLHRDRSLASADNGLIVFTDTGPSPADIPFDNVDVYAWDPATGERANLTNTPSVAEEGPVWSQDGTKVVFERTSATGAGGDLKTTHDLVVANGDFTDQRVIGTCDTACAQTDSAWSPDDQQIAWTAELRVGDDGYVGALQVYDLPSSTTKTFCDSRTCGFPGQPVWSPDGTRIAFSNTGIYRIPGISVLQGQIWIADVRSGEASRLTPDSCSGLSTYRACEFDSSPRWSADGNSVRFVRQVSTGAEQTKALMEINADGSGERTLTTCGAGDQCAFQPIAQAPDGSRIAYVGRYDTPSLVVLDAETGATDSISLPAGADVGEIAWSPDGSKLAVFAGGRRPDLLLVDPASGKVDDVLTQASSQGDLAWLPKGAVGPVAEPSDSSATSSSPVASIPDGTIVFGSSSGSAGEDDATEIWAVHTDGSDLTPLTDNGAIDMDPALSPDGSRIAFASYRQGDRNTQIYVMNADGTDQHALTDRRTGAVQPAWSPDGTKIAFVSGAGYGEPGGVFVMNADGTGLELLAEGNAFEPTWSPDGLSILYALNAKGQTHLWWADATCCHTTPTWTLPGDQDEPAVSPDGRTIAFVWSTPAGSAIYTSDVEGGSLNKIGVGRSPSWSPDGKWIAYAHTDDVSGPQIWMVRADGLGATPLTKMPGFVGDSQIYAITRDPSWGPQT